MFAPLFFIEVLSLALLHRELPTLCDWSPFSSGLACRIVWLADVAVDVSFCSPYFAVTARLIFMEPLVRKKWERGGPVASSRATALPLLRSVGNVDGPPDQSIACSISARFLAVETTLNPVSARSCFSFRCGPLRMSPSSPPHDGL